MTKATTRLVQCKALLQRSGWLAPAFVTVDGQGLIVSVAAAAPTGVPVSETIDGYVIPGFQNAHSHAFQYAMVGLAEHLPTAAANDDFWSWRDTMYRLAQQITPEQMQDVAAMLYAEMLRFGITAVTEFHYLHHDAGGKPYADAAEMGRRLMAAAANAGIHLTLVPVIYRQGGFGKPAAAAQARFLSRSLDDYTQLVDATRKAAVGKDDVVVGSAVHSLRAVAPDEVKALLAAPPPGPIHLHIAEQRKEVDDCLAHLGKRPIAWLLANAPVDARYHLVHATHADADEVRGMAASGATVVICPSTEGNLGDGFFPLKDYLAHGGGFSIGTDSHVTLSPLEDLRWLDYGQRLRLEKRNVLCGKGADDSGQIAFDAAWTRGRASMGLPAADYFAAGQPFDGLVLDAEHPVLAHRPAERRLAALIYAGDASCLLGTLRRGRWIVRGGRHERAAVLRQRFGGALAALFGKS